MPHAIDFTNWHTLEEREPAFIGEYYFGQLSELCDVTDGQRVGKARYRVGDSYPAGPGEDELWHMSGWREPDGYDDLSWTPTHWRPAAE